MVRSVDKKTDNEPAKQNDPREPEKPNGRSGRSRVSLVLVYGGIFAFLASWAGLLGNLGRTFWIFAAIVMLIASMCLALGLKLELRNHHWLKWQYNSVACSIVVLGLSLGLPVIVREILRSEPNPKEREDDYSGVLVPANDPTPLFDGQKLPTNCVVLLLGNSKSVTCWFPHTVIQYQGKPVLTISRTPQGAAVSGEFFGDNGNIVAVLETNRFIINHLNYFVKERPDKSTLIVRDQKNIKVLNVRFLNPNAMELSGRFGFPDHPDLVIDKSEGFFSQGITTAGSVVDFSIR